MGHDEAASVKLPISVVSHVDVAHLGREVEAVDAFLSQAQMRQPGSAMSLPKSSSMLEDFVKLNNLNLLTDADRQNTLSFLNSLKKNAPVIHISFAAEPSVPFLHKLCEWLRNEVSSTVLLQVGLQPSIAAGCVVRTTNKYFDFSLRQHLASKKKELAEILGGRE